ncbi:Zinc finger protein ZAT4 [Dendrobium catenatum]|uniref:Zinc finger protein ZAT4 n=1 Tax=Dendrobium catenatum TaxID=906689 RepID=A0A2I0X0F4_9ASPA|nr:Zinc finger protein ZAT4 [Dendrobium catenatum]
MNGALCLLMLSRGTHSIRDILDEIPPIIERGKKVHSYPSEDEDRPFKKPKVSCFNKKIDHGDISSHVLDVGKESSSKQYDCESGMYKSCKRNNYKCPICGKAFPTGQALGGHKRSQLVEGTNSASANVISTAGINGVHSQPTWLEIAQMVSNLNLIDLDLPTPDKDN